MQGLFFRRDVCPWADEQAPATFQVACASATVRHLDHFVVLLSLLHSSRVACHIFIYITKVSPALPVASLGGRSGALLSMERGAVCISGCLVFPQTIKHVLSRLRKVGGRAPIAWSVLPVGCCLAWNRVIFFLSHPVILLLEKKKAIGGAQVRGLQPCRWLLRPFSFKDERALSLGCCAVMVSILVQQAKVHKQQQSV